jgi:hypothetical protein
VRFIQNPDFQTEARNGLRFSFPLARSRRPPDSWRMKINVLLASLVVVLSIAACKPESNPGAKPETPAPAPATPPAAAPPAVADPKNPASYVGLEEKAAGAMADKAGVTWRIVEVDGESRPVTMDHRPDRLNFAIKDGKVIRVTQG